MSDQRSEKTAGHALRRAWDRCSAAGIPWLAVGVGVGAALGAGTGSLAWGVGVGAAVGLALQQAAGRKKPASAPPRG